jgi:hypothetical protein
MSRAAIAIPLGLAGFAAYIAAAVIVADAVSGAHWLAQAVYFVVAGLAWVPPALWLTLWASRG